MSSGGKLDMIYRWVVFVFGFMATGDALAYLDPGTGSMLLQVLLGGVAAIAVAVKLYWYRILAIFGIKKEIEAEEESS